MPALRGVAQLLASLPYQLDYRPERSLVLVAGWLGPAPSGPGGTSLSEVEVTLRVDLPLQPEHLDAVLDQVVPALARAVRHHRPELWHPDQWEEDGWETKQPALLGHLFVYDGEDGDDGLVVELLERARARLMTVGTAVLELHVVRGDSYLPVVTAGDPVPGRVEAGVLVHTAADWQQVADPSEVPAVADYVLAGRNPDQRRGDVVDGVRQRDGRAAAATSLAVDLLMMDPSRLDEPGALRALGRWAVDGEELSARERAAVAVTLTDRFVRDLVLCRWVPRLFPRSAMVLRPGDDELCDAVAQPGDVPGGTVVSRLLVLAGRLPEDLSVPVLTIAGCLAWSEGDGTVANEAIALALEHDPGYRMALLIRAALAQGVSPRMMTAAAA